VLVGGSLRGSAVSEWGAGRRRRNAPGLTRGGWKPHGGCRRGVGAGAGHGECVSEEAGRDEVAVADGVGRGGRSGRVQNLGETFGVQAPGVGGEEDSPRLPTPPDRADAGLPLPLGIPGRVRQSGARQRNGRRRERAGMVSPKLDWRGRGAVGGSFGDL